MSCKLIGDNATPLLKKTVLDESSMTSYTPVQNLSHISKIFVRIIHCQMISYLEDNKLLPVNLLSRH